MKHVHFHILNIHINDLCHLPISKRGVEFLYYFGGIFAFWLLIDSYKVLLGVYKEP